MKIFINLHIHSTEELDDSSCLPDHGCQCEIQMSQPVFGAPEARGEGDAQPPPVNWSDASNWSMTRLRA
jgi:hypothetical protein